MTRKVGIEDRQDEDDPFLVRILKGPKREDLGMLIKMFARWHWIPAWKKNIFPKSGSIDGRMVWRRGASQDHLRPDFTVQNAQSSRDPALAKDCRRMPTLIA